MADFGSGSGDGAGGANVGVGRSGGAWDDGSDAEPDEDGLPGGDHTFADLDGSGSGHGPNEPNNWNSGGSGVKKTGKATRCDRLPSAFRVMLLLMMDDEGSSSDYWTEPGAIC